MNKSKLYFPICLWIEKELHVAAFVQKGDDTIHWINHYPADSMVCFVNIYLLDSNLSKK